MIAQLAFAVILIAAIVLFRRSVLRIVRSIRIGRPVPSPTEPKQRWRNLLWVAVGQGKMTVRPVAGIMHILIYVGFLVINAEVLEIIVDGMLGTHRVFGPILGPIYDLTIAAGEIFFVLVLLAVVVFVARRDVSRRSRFVAAEMRPWNHLDARIILWTEVILILALITMNATDQLSQQLEYGEVRYGAFPISALFTGLFSGLDADALHTVSRVAWWVHIVGILAFLNYIPYSKHLHIFVSFPNVWWSNTSVTPLGSFANNEKVKSEVAIMMGGDPYATPAPVDNAPAQPERFGAKDVADLGWTDLMSAYACTECGRCTSVCPANITGKLLSPRKIMMDTRDRLETVGRAIEKTGTWTDDGKSLLDDHITREEIWACTTCNACAQACPVNINPVSIISQLRQYVVMEESKAPEQLNGMFNNVQNAGTPWAFSPSDRFNWSQQIEIASDKLPGTTVAS